jgi:hypothetical protein
VALSSTWGGHRPRRLSSPSTFVWWRSDTYDSYWNEDNLLWDIAFVQSYFHHHFFIYCICGIKFLIKIYYWEGCLSLLTLKKTFLLHFAARRLTKNSWYNYFVHIILLFHFISENLKTKIWVRTQIVFEKKVQRWIKRKAVPLHAMEALVLERGTAPTHFWPWH